MTAGRTNQTVGMAEPQIADINGTAMLGGEPVAEACRVDEGNGTECKPQTRLQQMKSLCKEIIQHSGNANRAIPDAYGLPLEGEWSVLASGKTSDPKGDANASNAAVEPVDSPSELEGCREGTSKSVSVDVAAAECCQQLGMADVDPGQGVEPMDVPNKLQMLVILLIKLKSMDSSEIPHVCLGGTRWHVCDVEGLRD